MIYSVIPEKSKIIISEKTEFSAFSEMNPGSKKGFFAN